MATIKKVYQEYHYILDPHGAVGWLALEKYLQTQTGKKGIFLETAHPVKFPDAVEKMTGTALEVPPAIRSIMSMKKKSLLMNSGFDELKSYLLTGTKSISV